MPTRSLAVALAAIIAGSSLLLSGANVIPGIHPTVNAYAADSTEQAKTTNLVVNIEDISDSGAVMEGFSVSVSGIDTEYSIIKATDKNGSIRINNIPAGKYKVTFLGGTSMYSPSAYASLTKDELELSSDYSEKTLTLKVRKQSEKSPMLAFRFTDKNNTIQYAPSGLEMTIVNESTGASYTSTCSDSGVVRFGNIDEGDYKYTITNVPSGFELQYHGGETGTIQNITKNKYTTGTIFLSAEELDDAVITFQAKDDAATADLGDSNYSKMLFNLCRYEKDAYTPVTTFTYDDIVNGKATYDMSGEDRHSSWALILKDNENDGHAAYQMNLTGIADSNTNSFSFTIDTPKIITNNVIITGPVGHRINLKLKNENLISENDTKTNVDLQIPKNGTINENKIPVGNITVENMPFGEYIATDLTTKQTQEFKIQYDGIYQLIDFTPDNTDDYYIQKYTLYDVFWNKVCENSGTIDDIQKPASQGDKACLYRVELEEGNPYSPVGTAAMMANVRIGSDGTMKVFDENDIGDANNDHSFTIADLVSLQRYLLNIDAKACPQWELADLDGDDQLTAMDLCMLKSIMLQKTSK